MIEQLNDEDEVRKRHRQRIEEMRRSKEKQMMRRRILKKYVLPAAGCVIGVSLIIGGVKHFHKSPVDNREVVENNEGTVNGDYIKMTEKPIIPLEQLERLKELSTDTDVIAEVSFAGDGMLGLSAVIGQLKGTDPNKTYSAEKTVSTWPVGDTLKSGDPFYSQYAVLIDLSNDTILAEKYAQTKINPASMTKILTVLVAAEHVTRLDDTFTITLDITDYGYINDCSSAGFEENETVTVRDLFYGTVLPSGADAAVGLATYVAGDQEAFVEMMNEKLKDLGIADTAHFTNCVGIYDEDHYCTVYDMAIILEAALDNPLCREVLSAHTYTTSKTEQHPEGIIISNWFLRRIEDKDTGGEVVCAKTGYVVQSGNCAASYAVDESGKGYVCVTAGANSVWRCIYDHAGLYKQFSVGG